MDNIEKLVIAWLTANGPSGWPVSGDVPKQRPAKFVTVDRTGGGREAMVLDRATLNIEFYHKTSRAEASDAANAIADKIVELEAYNENITHASVNSLVSLDDTLGQYHRYQLYIDCYLRR